MKNKSENSPSRLESFHIQSPDLCEFALQLNILASQLPILNSQQFDFAFSLTQISINFFFRLIQSIRLLKIRLLQYLGKDSLNLIAFLVLDIFLLSVRYSLPTLLQLLFYPHHELLPIFVAIQLQYFLVVFQVFVYALCLVFLRNHIVGFSISSLVLFLEQFLQLLILFLQEFEIRSELYQQIFIIRPFRLWLHSFYLHLINVIKIKFYIQIYIKILNQAKHCCMLMSLLKWQAKILNKLYKTQRYEKLIQLKLTNPEQINYQYFFEITPDVNPSQYTRLIEATNVLCRPSTRALAMQKEVAFLNEFMKKMTTSPMPKILEENTSIKQQQNSVQKLKFTLQHVVIYSSLSKCRIWPKILKSGIGFVPNLIQFYNSFTKQNGDWLDFKFDPVILSQKYTKIMKKVNLKKRDHPKLVEAITKNNIQQIKNILGKLEDQYKLKNQIKEQDKQSQETIISTIINNISHKGLAISHVCCRNSSLQTIKYLHELGADFEILDDEQQTAIFYAVKRSDLELIKYLVEEIKVDLNHREYQNRTALYLAAFEGYLDIVDYLIKKGANPEMCSKLDRTPLSKACYLGNIKVVQYLLSINVDMLKQDNKGRTALHNAAWGIEGGRDGKRRGHVMLEDSPQCAELLLKAGHPVDFQDYDGFTPFFSAVSSCAIRSMYLLIKYKTNIYHKTKNQQTAVFIAAKYGHLQVLKILINEFNLDFIEPDYHGYSPLCASITLQKSDAFNYLCDLYMKHNIKLDSKLIIACVRQYETTHNLLFIREWLKQQNNTTTDLKQKKAVYLSQILFSLADSLKQLKKEKKKLKKQLENIFKKKSKNHTQKNTQLSQKIKFKKFTQIIQKQQEQQTQDHDTLTPPPLKQPPTNPATDINKQLNKIRELSNMILVTCSEIVIGLQSSIKIYMKQQNVDSNQDNMEKIKQNVLVGYNGKQYKGVVMFLLAQWVFVFNNGKKLPFADGVDTMLQLAKIIHKKQSQIPPFYIPHEQSKQQQSILPKQSKQVPQQDLTLLSQYLSQSQSLQLHPSQIFNLKITPHQSQSQLIKLLLNKQVAINLTMNEHELNNCLFKLAKYRKTAVIIAIFNCKTDVGKVSYERLLDIVQGKHFGQDSTGDGLSLISFCILHGLSDISVYLQQICKSPENQRQVSIPQYSIQRKILTPEQCNIDLEPTDSWVFEFDQLLQRMSAKQKQIYKQYIILPQQNEQQKQLTFQTCKKYQTVSTKAQLEELEKTFEEFILIGIDVEYYQVSKEEYFICSIQISNGEGVYILDTLSHLYEDGGDITARLNPELIGDFMRKLMRDQRKIKIFHAYENDVKWLHEDYDLRLRKEAKQIMQNEWHKNNNVIDTSRMYNLCNKVKKGESVGLRTLCKQYLNFEMEKNFQRSDWRIRPLFKEMIQYASLDAEVLPYIYLKMLVQSQQTDWIEKLKGGFCIKRNMKSRGVRNRLVPKMVQQKLVNSN